jgi:CMP-N,N'-diacetyllegionaminic acid synthase
MKILAIIPARGGSKGIPRKNLKKVCGKTLLCRAYECAVRSMHAMDVVVSTDCPDILGHAKSLGYSGEYVRPSELALDDSRTVDAVLDVLSWSLEHKDKYYDVIVLLQPSSPLRLSSDLDAALEIFLSTDNATSLISVSEMCEHPVECVVASSHGWQYLVEPKRSYKGRQSYDQNYFFINGAIYICTYEHLIQNKSFIDSRKSILYQIPKLRALDIDTEEDLELANCLCMTNR